MLLGVLLKEALANLGCPVRRYRNEQRGSQGFRALTYCFAAIILYRLRPKLSKLCVKPSLEGPLGSGDDTSKKKASNRSGASSSIHLYVVKDLPS